VSKRERARRTFSAGAGEAVPTRLGIFVPLVDLKALLALVNNNSLEQRLQAAVMVDDWITNRARRMSRDGDLAGRAR
jgi:hypothetical protein